MTNPNHNPARLAIAGAMYWNAEDETYVRALHTAEVQLIEVHTYKPYPWGEEADDITVADTYTENGGGDTYYYDGTGTNMVPTAVLFLQDDIENLKDLL